MKTQFETISKMTLVAVALAALTIAPVMAQAGADKDTKKLKEKVGKARESLETAVGQVKETMALYNALFEPEVKKPESIYKKLEKGIEGCDKAAKDARKYVDTMHKDLTEFYAGWEKEIEAFASDSMKQRGQQSLEKVRSRYERFDTALKGASELYHPFIASLRDYTMFLSRDLSPDALSALQEEAAGLNESATALYAKIDEALNDTNAAQDAVEEPADDSYPADGEGEESAGGEGSAGDMEEGEEEGAAEED